MVHLPSGGFVLIESGISLYRCLIVLVIRGDDEIGPGKAGKAGKASRGAFSASPTLVVRAACGVRTIRKAARIRVVVLAAVAQEAAPDGGSRRRSPPFRSQGSEEEGDDDREPPVAWGMKLDREAEHGRDTQGGNKSFEEASHAAPRSGLLERSPIRARSRRCTAGCPGSSRTLWASRHGRSERADSRRRSCD